MISKLVTNTLGPCQQASRIPKVTAGDIDEVILVGGSTRIPLVQQEVEKFFGKSANQGVNPDEVVATGAVIEQASSQVMLRTFCSRRHSSVLNIETYGGVMTKLIERNTTIPHKASQIFTTAADNQNAFTVHIRGRTPHGWSKPHLGKFNLEAFQLRREVFPRLR